MIIAFFGPDGTGKTTMAKMLKMYLIEKGYRVSYVRLKSHHLAMYLLLATLKKFNIIPNTNSPRILDYSLKRCFSRSKLFIYLELLNVIIWIFINIKIREMFKKRIIVAERYIPDFIVSMLLITPSRNTLYLLLRILRPLMRGTIKIFLYASSDDILHRKRDELLSEKYVNILIRKYSLVSSFFGTDLRINTSKYSKIEAFQQVKKLIHNKFTAGTRERRS